MRLTSFRGNILYYQEEFDMGNLQQYLPLLIPLAIIELGLMVVALIHIFRHKTYRVGNRVIWVIVCILINIIGPVLYFAIGKGDE